MQAINVIRVVSRGSDYQINQHNIMCVHVSIPMHAHDFECKHICGVCTCVVCVKLVMVSKSQTKR